jgi:hypothetical protein
VSAVRAFGNRRTNAELMVDCATLGYLDGSVIDMTYGLGRFWAKHHPAHLVTVDLDPTLNADIVADFTNLPFPDRSFRSAVFDPPYKLNGTSTGKGPATSDVDYGVGGGYASIAERHALIFAGMTEAARLVEVGGIVIVKCQDQVCSGDIQFQTDLVRDHGLTIGLRKIDVLHVGGYRKQPARTRKHDACRGHGCDGCVNGRIESRQQHAARDYSTAVVFERQRPMSPRYETIQPCLDLELESPPPRFRRPGMRVRPTRARRRHLLPRSR